MTAVNDDADRLGSDSTVLARRMRLEARPNPGVNLDYLSVLTANTPGDGVKITLRYVPAKLSLSADTFAGYLAMIAPESERMLEALALAVLDDINNEIVPRWVQIVAVRTAPDTTVHQVIVEDRQPKWDNPALLARLERY